MMRWYAVHTKPKMERWARTNLWERGFEIYLPEYRRRRSHARKVDYVAAPLFPRYLFVRADLSASGVRAINTAPGAVGIVSFGGRPAVAPDDVITELQRRETEEGFVRFAPGDLKPGDRVRVLDGAFADQLGICQKVSDSERVVLLLSILGRDVRTSVARELVSPAG